MANICVMISVGLIENIIARKIKWKGMGKTIYIVTHDYEFINECCDSVIKLK